MNWGQIGGWAGAILALVSAVGYLYAEDYRRAIYFFFAFCITLTVVWPGK